MFSSYVFVNYQSGAGKWPSIQSTIGVQSVVLQGEKHGLLPSDFVDGLRSREVDGIILRPAERFDIDQQVFLQGAPLDGLVGEILEMRENDRILVLLSLLGQAVRLNLEACRLRANED